MIKQQFHKSEKGLGDEDWYYLAVDPKDSSMQVVHEWSHSAGRPPTFATGERTYSLQEFKDQHPNQYRRLLEWLCEQCNGA